MANRFATRAQWSIDSTVYPKFDYLVVLPDNFTGTSGVFPFKISDGSTPANRLPFAPNSAPFTLPGSSGGSVSITNVPLPITSTDLNLEATQQEVKTAVEKFQFDALGNLKTTGGGAGGGDATAANQVIGNASLASIDGKLTNPLPVSIPGAIAVTGPLTDAQLRATPVPVSGTVSTGGLTDAQLRAAPVPVSAASLPLPTGAATEATLSTLTGKIPASLTVVGTALKVDGSAVTQPVSGPLTDAQLRATPVPVSGTVSTGGLTDAELRASAVPVSAAALPLPSGAATAALQTQPGVDIGDVTVNNAAGAAAVNVQDGGNSLTVDGTVTITPPTLTKGTQGATGLSVQNLRDAGRTAINVYTTAITAGTTATETAITLTIAVGNTAVATGTSFTPTSGKTFRITSINLFHRGSATATAATSVFSLRVNTAGAATTTSNPILRWSMSNPATALAVDRLTMSFPEGIDIFGDGTLQWTITAQSSYVTNPPAWALSLTGYEW